jgi:hypothetical protein
LLAALVYPEETMKTPRVVALERALDDAERYGLEVNELDEVEAWAIAASLSVEEWAELNGRWRDRAVSWRIRLAETLAESGPDVADDWLVEMIDHGDDELALAAIEGFRELQAKRAVPTPLPEATAHRVRTLWRAHFSFSETQLASLVDDLRTPSRGQR